MKRDNAYASTVASLAEHFRDPDGFRSEYGDDAGGTYALHLNKGDGEMVMTAMVRRADAGAFDLRGLLDRRRVDAWRKTASRHAHLTDPEMSAIAARLRRSANARTESNIAMMEVDDDAFDETVAALTDPKAERLLPGIILSVEDQLDSYWLNVTVAGTPLAAGLEYVKGVFDRLTRANCLILATAPHSPFAYEVFDK